MEDDKAIALCELSERLCSFDRACFAHPNRLTTSVGTSGKWRPDPVSVSGFLCDYPARPSCRRPAWQVIKRDFAAGNPPQMPA